MHGLQLPTKNTIAILFGKVCFCICPLSFIQISISVLIMGAMHICAFANNYSKCVKSKYSAYFLEFSRKRNTIKENIYDGVRL